MLRIATRRSPLARWQAEWVQSRLQELHIPAELVLLTSQGDIDSQPIDGSQSVGLFTKRIQQAVLDKEAEIAVHSLKDLPTQIDTGLTLAAVPPRAPVADCLVTLTPISFDDLPQGARIGTGSRRRAAQLLTRRPDLLVEPIRGNVQTRLGKLNEGYAAIVLAEAGLQRLGMDSFAIQPLDTEWMVPAPGQGALGIEVCDGDQASYDQIHQLNCPITSACVVAERTVLRELRAGCLAPVGALATVDDVNLLTLHATVLSLDGKTRLQHRLSLKLVVAEQATDQPLAKQWGELAVELGSQVANALLDAGAGPLIAAAR